MNPSHLLADVPYWLGLWRTIAYQIAVPKTPAVETRGTATGPKGPQVKTTLNPHSTKCGLFSLRCSQLLELRSS